MNTKLIACESFQFNSIRLFGDFPSCGLILINHAIERSFSNHFEQKICLTLAFVGLLITILLKKCCGKHDRMRIESRYHYSERRMLPMPRTFISYKTKKPEAYCELMSNLYEG